MGGRRPSLEDKAFYSTYRTRLARNLENGRDRLIMPFDQMTDLRRYTLRDQDHRYIVPVRKRLELLLDLGQAGWGLVRDDQEVRVLLDILMTDAAEKKPRRCVLVRDQADEARSLSSRVHFSQNCSAPSVLPLDAVPTKEFTFGTRSRRLTTRGFCNSVISVFCTVRWS